MNQGWSITIRKVIKKVLSDPRRYAFDTATLISLLGDLMPACQAEDPSALNIGFGFLYYSLARILRPQVTVVIGSLKGFSVVCFAMGVKDNYPVTAGKVYFVDPGYSDRIDGKLKGMGGVGVWSNPDYRNWLVAKYGLLNVLEIFPVTSQEFLDHYSGNVDRPIDLLFIDGDHSYTGFRHDLENFETHLSDKGVILAHDVLVKTEDLWGYEFGISKYVQEVVSQEMRYEYVTLPPWPGLVIMRRKSASSGISKSEDLRGLVRIYEDRPDLRMAFPEAALGHYERLLEWAVGVISGRIADPSRDKLAKFAVGLKEEQEATRRNEDH